MDIALMVLILLLVGGIALGMYMNWFGLWVSKDDLRNEKNRAAKSHLQDLGRQIGVSVPESAKVKEKTGTAVTGTHI